MSEIPAIATGGAGTVVFEASGLTKVYDDGQVQALRGVDLRIHEGEFVAIVGPSGSGKSTMLQLLGGLDHPTSGTLRYRGTALSEMKDVATYRALQIGFVFQAFHLLPAFNAVENVQIPMLESAMNRAERGQRAQQLLETVGMSHRLRHYPAKLSGGERQRVAIARSLANKPKVLLADEPTGNLDSENAAKVLELLVALHQQQGMTLILVTHDMGIASLAQRVIRMKDGRIASDEQVGVAHTQEVDEEVEVEGEGEDEGRERNHVEGEDEDGDFQQQGGMA